MSKSLVIDVSDLVGHPERGREFSESLPVSLRLGDSVAKGVAEASGGIEGTIDGVLARFAATAPIHLTCVRCLREWDDTVQVEGTQHFARVPDEDGYRIEEGEVDLSGPVIDELALAIPAAPLCRQGCKGLCPICGSDLNSDPCAGHGEESDSPFAVLRDLLDS